MANKKVSTIIIATILFFFSYSVIEAATYYVSSNGSGTTCSASTPCSLTSGISKLTPGDILYLKSGKYLNIDIK